jgi:endonuclease/exonuclease/phosphatase family metal-dependent hydrolase
LISWNIHKGIGGVDRSYQPERVVEVVAHYDPDVVLLQEVDEGVPRSRRHDQAELLAEQLGFRHVAFGPNVRLKQGRYGNATLSRIPIVESENHDLTFPMKKARGALHTELAVPVDGHSYTVHLLNVHLGLAGVERRWQVRRLLAVPPLSHHDPRSRIVVAGDTNDWGGTLPGGRLDEAGFRCVTGVRRRALRTFPAWAPVGALDRVFLRGPLRCEGALRSRMELARQASDHLPLVVDLTLE